MSSEANLWVRNLDEDEKDDHEFESGVVLVLQVVPQKFHKVHALCQLAVHDLAWTDELGFSNTNFTLYQLNKLR